LAFIHQEHHHARTEPTHSAAALLVAALFSAGATAQTMVYPAKGQSRRPAEEDASECNTWAVQQSKYDPANPPPPPDARPSASQDGDRTTPGAGRARGGTRRGRRGEIVADDAGAGAAVGAAAARGQSRRQNAAQGQQQQQAAAPAAAGRHGQLQQGARGVPRRPRLQRQVSCDAAQPGPRFMSATSPVFRDLRQTPRDFSLVLGGPLYQLLRRAICAATGWSCCTGASPPSRSSAGFRCCCCRPSTATCCMGGPPCRSCWTWKSTSSSWWRCRLLIAAELRGAPLMRFVARQFSIGT
jgi:hypothetical protein